MQLDKGACAYDRAVPVGTNKGSPLSYVSVREGNTAIVVYAALFALCRSVTVQRFSVASGIILKEIQENRQVQLSAA